MKESYKLKNKEVKRSDRRDKGFYVEEKASQAEEVVSRGELSKVYKIIRELCDAEIAQNPLVKDTQGKAISTEQE